MTVRINWTAWTGSVVILGILPILVSLPPWVSEPMQFALMYAFDPFCHQLAERSPHINGIQIAVCNRCYGILTGLVLGPVLALVGRAWFLKWSRPLIIASMGALILDWSMGYFSVWSGPAEVQLITGGLFGVVAGTLVTHALSWHDADQQFTSSHATQEVCSFPGRLRSRPDQPKTIR